MLLTYLKINVPSFPPVAKNLNSLDSYQQLVPIECEKCSSIGDWGALFQSIYDIFSLGYSYLFSNLSSPVTYISPLDIHCITIYEPLSTFLYNIFES
jgi:hypothetical protein